MRARIPSALRRQDVWAPGGHNLHLRHRLLLSEKDSEWMPEVFQDSSDLQLTKPLVKQAKWVARPVLLVRDR